MVVVELELELDRPSRPSITSDQRKDQILKAALRNVDLHDWDAVIVEDNKRLRLQGGSVSLDLGLSAPITRYLEGDDRPLDLIAPRRVGLNLPDDSPGDLYVPGRTGQPLETTIVAIDGLQVTLSVADDLGDCVPRATLQSDLTQLLRTLIQRVECFAGRDNPAGARLLGEVEASGEAPEWRVERLNHRQAEAVTPEVAGSNRTIVTVAPEARSWG